MVLAQIGVGKLLTAVFKDTNEENTKSIKTFAGITSQFLATMFGESKEWAIASALVSTYQGIAEAMKLPWPLNLAAAAMVGAIGFKQVASIQSTGKGGGGGGSAGVGGVGGLGATPATPDLQPQGVFDDEAGGGSQAGVQIIIEGNIIGQNEETKQWLTEVIGDAVENQDFVVVPAGSRNARDLQ